MKLSNLQVTPKLLDVAQFLEMDDWATQWFSGKEVYTFWGGKKSHLHIQMDGAQLIMKETRTWITVNNLMKLCAVAEERVNFL